MESEVIGTVIGSGTMLLIIRFVVPEAVRSNWKWMPLLALVLTLGAVVGLWVGSIFD